MNLSSYSVVNIENEDFGDELEDVKNVSLNVPKNVQAIIDKVRILVKRFKQAPSS